MAQPLHKLVLLIVLMFGVSANAISNTRFIRQTTQDDQSIIGFTARVFEVAESVGVVHITVRRDGNTSGPATVDFATDDTGASIDCAKLTGLASSRCDFDTALGTLNFAPGEVEKSFDVLINRDSYVETPSEVFTVFLSKATGATLGTDEARVQIDDSSAGVSGLNIIQDTRAFVRQHYHDFLNREPDAAGLEFWVNNIDRCNNEASPRAVDQCKEIARINTSAAFFLSIEFSQTGGFVNAVYLAALDRPSRMPSYLEFVRDEQAVGRGVIVGEGDFQQTLKDNQEAFLKEFVMRAEFVGLYPTNDSPATYVNKLYIHAIGRPATRIELAAGVAEFGNSLSAADPGARGQVLLQVINAKAFRNDPNSLFVRMQYVGYLRRNPDELPDFNLDGFNFWLEKLNQFRGNFVEADMVKAFIESGEYRARFGP